MPTKPERVEYVTLLLRCSRCREGKIESAAWSVWLANSDNTAEPPPAEPRWKACEWCKGVGYLLGQDGKVLLEIFRRSL